MVAINAPASSSALQCRQAPLLPGPYSHTFHTKFIGLWINPQRGWVMRILASVWVDLSTRGGPTIHMLIWVSFRPYPWSLEPNCTAPQRPRHLLAIQSPSAASQPARMEHRARLALQLHAPAFAQPLTALQPRRGLGGSSTILVCSVCYADSVLVLCLGVQ